MRRFILLFLLGMSCLTSYSQAIPPQFTEPNFPSIAGHEVAFPQTRICYDFFGLLESLGINRPGYSNNEWQIWDQIQDCVDHLQQATPNGSVVWVLSFPAGTYRLHNRVKITGNNLIIKGAGVGQTRFKWVGNTANNNGGPLDDYAFFVGDNSTDGQEVRIHGTNGSTMITLPDANGTFGYDRILLTRDDPGGGDDYFIRQNSRIVYGWGGTNYILDEPLRMDYNGYVGNAKAIKVTYPQFVGFECFSIDSYGNTTSGQKKDEGGWYGHFRFEYAQDCYVRGVDSRKPVYQHVTITYSSNIEVSGCYFEEAHDYGPGGHGYGVNVSNGSSECLIQNNIFRKLRHAMLVQYGANGNVFAYNYSRESNPDGDESGYDDLVGHGNYAFRNLFEGNSVDQISFDTKGDHNGPRNVVFRNETRERNIRVGAPFVNSAPETCVVGNNTETCIDMGGNGHTTYDNENNGFPCCCGHGFNNTTTGIGTSIAFNTRPSYIPAADWPVFGPGGTDNLPAQNRWNSGNYTMGGNCSSCPAVAPIRVTATTYPCTDYGFWVDPGSIYLSITGGVPPYEPADWNGSFLIEGNTSATFNTPTTWSVTITDDVGNQETISGYTGPCDDNNGGPFIKKQDAASGLGSQVNPIELDATVFPNPTTGKATLEIEINQQDQLRIGIFNASGQLVGEISNLNITAAGTHQYQLPLEGQPAGIYFCRIQGSDHHKVIRVVKQ